MAHPEKPNPLPKPGVDLNRWRRDYIRHFEFAPDGRIIASHTRETESQPPTQNTPQKTS